MAGPRSCQVEPRCWGRAVNNPEGSPGPPGAGWGRPRETNTSGGETPGSGGHAGPRRLCVPELSERGR